MRRPCNEAWTAPDPVQQLVLRSSGPLSKGEPWTSEIPGNVHYEMKASLSNQARVPCTYGVES